MASSFLDDCRRRLAVIVGVAAALVAMATLPVYAQRSTVAPPPAIGLPSLDADDPDDLPATAPAAPGTDGSLVFHGNYCGPGSRGTGRPPIDPLDEACMHHDACSPPVGTALPSCACNLRLQREAAAVARNPRTPDDIRVAAQFVSEGAKVLACQR